MIRNLVLTKLNWPKIELMTDGRSGKIDTFKIFASTKIIDPFITHMGHIRRRIFLFMVIIYFMLEILEDLYCIS